jgi:hypothetical protein
MIRRPLFIILFLATAIAANAFELRDSRYGGLGRCALLSQPTSANLVNLAGDGRPIDGAQIEAGYNRRFELADLDYVFLAGSYRYRQVTFALGASQFGKSELYAEQLLKGSIAVRYRAFSFGVAPSAMQIQIGNDYGTLHAATVGVGATCTGRVFKINVCADNLTRPRFLDVDDRIQPYYTLMTEYFGHQAFSLTGRVRAEEGQKPQFGLGQWIRLSPQSAFFWGVAGQPTEYGGGLELGLPVGSLTYAVGIHPVLGMTHTITLTYHPGRVRSLTGDEFD